MIHASVIKSAVGWFRHWGILKYLLGGVGLSLALFGFILPTISTAERAAGLFCFCGGLVIVMLVITLGWFIPSYMAYGLYYGDWLSLDNKKLHKVLIKHRSSFNLGPELRERCRRVNFGFGLSGNGYEIMNGLAPEWELSFGELLETVASLDAN